MERTGSQRSVRCCQKEKGQNKSRCVKNAKKKKKKKKRKKKKQAF